MKFLLLLILNLGLALAAPAQEEPASYLGNLVSRATEFVSDFFSEYDEPAYKVVRTIGDSQVEERKYPGGLAWACTDEENAANGDENIFWRLFQYIQGQNEGGVKIAMTTPVKMERFPGEKGERNMCFYLKPYTDQEPPAPTNAKISIVRSPEMNIYTRRVGGYMDDADWDYEFNSLKTFLKANNVADFNEDKYYANGYDSPMMFYNRRNEVWVTKE
ncbi:hypothetical protein TCAL_08504 [Tigriopus californicus]|uniref:Heme-binding protein 2 n=1 Tax=Tigriopus californicus TaxID=6832 RepID=A0A553PJE0_TIGCA|nr:heme-binding protein 1-like [Tigriopus californicus]TRY77769.1 hypothetical protein TCAL_08504 [Tigriopus californicus]|eukprot:TCALIF_08504-PA protein Name:"Similar to HEBP1 Heme-binding protein 1 (Gallus gallus)" AED:0.00 eAED:0.00 QI:229/1/1/1/0.75/1/5/70/216